MESKSIVTKVFKAFNRQGEGVKIDPERIVEALRQADIITADQVEAIQRRCEGRAARGNMLYLDILPQRGESSLDQIIEVYEKKGYERAAKFLREEKQRQESHGAIERAKTNNPVVNGQPKVERKTAGRSLGWRRQ